MKQRDLGSTGMKVSELAFGTWGACARAYSGVYESLDVMLRGALELGITTFDVAPWWGESEALVGSAMMMRRDAIIVTRGGRAADGGRLLSTKDELVAQVEASLRSLRRDSLDVWLFSAESTSALERSVWRETVDTLKSSGKIRAAGVTAAKAETLRAAIAQGAEVIATQHNMLHTDDLLHAAVDIQQKNVGVLALSPLAYGLLSGTWPLTRTFPPDDHRALRWSKTALDARLRHVARLGFIAKPPARSLAEAAVRYVLANEDVSSVATGVRSMGQLRELAQASGDAPYLEYDDLMRVTQILAALDGVRPG